MAVRYAVAAGSYTLASGAVVSVFPGETRDSVSDGTEIAIWTANWVASPVPTAATVGTQLFAWEAVYPRGQV